MSVWRRGPLTENPYLRTAFRVARVPVEVVRHRTVVQLIGQARRIISADPQAHTIAGETVTDAEMNVAEQVLLDPVRRALEELIHHRAETPPLGRVRELSKKAVRLMAADGETGMPLTNLRALLPWAEDVLAQALADMPVADPAIGALELRLVPPFGQIGDD